MPYKTFKVQGGWKNWKVNEMGDKVGDPLSDKPLSEEDAKAQVRALYASENKEATQTKMWGDEPGMWIPVNITTFADLDAYLQSQEMTEDMRHATDHFSALAQNVMMSDMVDDKAAALSSLAGEFSDRMKQPMEDKEIDEKATAEANNLPDSDFLYIESGGKKDDTGRTVPRSLRHLRVDDVAHVRNAIARLSQSDTGTVEGEKWLTASLRKTLLGKARKMLESMNKEVDEESLVERVFSKVKELLDFGSRHESQEEKQQSFSHIWKEGGQYRCLLAYTNNFRDSDNPPEIISAQSHKEFDTALNRGNWPMPELWLWHVPYKVGEVVTHAYDEKSGFSLAGGVFDSDKSWAAEAIMKRGWDGLSHGY
jgi:hypothetical protein